MMYQKQAITAALNGQCNQSYLKNNTLMLLPTALTKSWIYYMLSFAVSWTFLVSGKRFLIENFTGVLIMNFTPDWESEIAQISQKIDVITQK